MPRMRDAVASDYEAYAALFPELAVPDPIPTRERFAGELMQKSFVVEDGEIVGWGLVEALEGVGYVRQVIVSPSRRRRGLGRAIMGEAARRFRAAGCTRWCLNVKPENRPAVALYRSLGMERAFSSVALRMPFTIRERLPPSDGQIEIPTEGELEAIEEALSVTRGLLAPLLARDDRHLVLVRAGNEAVGLACFDPAFPGCYPFRARSAGHARALLDAIAPHATSPHLQLVAEDQPHLVTALVEAGAEPVLAFEHFAGTLPG